jgi:hypothetical protein
MGGRSAKDNFKRRFGDPARIKIEYAKDKIAPSEEAYQSEQISKAYAGVLKGILGRVPTQDEIVGKTDIARHLKKR